MLIPGYPTGSDLTIIDTSYQYSKKVNGQYQKDVLTVLYRNNTTGEKELAYIEEPDYEFYEAKEQYYTDHELFFIEQDKVNAVKVPFNSLLKKIAEDTGNLDFFYNNIKSGNRDANRRLHQVTTVFNSDMDIQDHFRFRFSREYTNNSFELAKAYFDIEADTINMIGEFPELGECPINAITYIDDSNNNVYTLLLRNKENKLIEEFESSISPELFRELKQFVIDSVGGEKKAEYHKIIDYQFEIIFFDDEISLIQEFFAIVNLTSPDLLLAWNMAFDIPYIIERIKNLGYRPEDIACDKSVPEKYRRVRYYIDEDNKNKPEEKGDYYFISGKTAYLDQMVHFASRRKGQHKLDSNKLDYIGSTVGVNKLDYSHITTSIAKLPYLNYKVFVFYNIMDTIVQVCIENKVQDMNYTFNKCLINNTRYNKCHRQSVYLKNRGIKEFFKNGFIMGNNKNTFNQKPTEKFPGALVGNPLNNSDYSKETLFGVPINVFRNLMDYDYKALYPSIVMQFNIAPNTQLGMINIKNKVWDRENQFEYDKYARGGQFIEDFKSGICLEFCNRWLHLANYEELVADMIEFFKLHPCGVLLDPVNAPSIEAIQPYDFKFYGKQEPISLINDTGLKEAVIFYPPKRTFEAEIDMIRNEAQMDLYDIESIYRRKELREDEEDIFSDIY